MRNNVLRADADRIIKESIEKVLPDYAVKQVLGDREFGVGRVLLIAVGKAAWQMAHAASEILGDKIAEGLVVTKYDHVKGDIPSVQMIEAGHPVFDENSVRGAQTALDMVRDLSPEDTVLFLLSGGGSALFEMPLIPQEELADITGRLLRSGADIVEINTIRKRLSAVKGGKFALSCAPAKICNIILSDIVGDPLDMIASGPTCLDQSTSAQALAIIEKYEIPVSERARRCLEQETPRELPNVETYVNGSVRYLCQAAAESSRQLGYEPVILTTSLSCIAREAGSFLASIAREKQDTDRSLAFIAGGETVVQVTGKGKGGRNQELALAAAAGIAGLQDTAVFSIGSDGTDGPTDAAGGYVDGETAQVLQKQGIQIEEVLKQNDAYPALQACDGLIVTGATGTNVNDVAVLLIKR